jgi:hypothetical protein
MQLYWQVFFHAPILPFACTYLLALAMPGWRSLAVVGLLASVVTAAFLVDWWQDKPTHYFMSVREAYKWHLAVLPIMLGLVGGTALRAYQLRNGRPRFGWTAVGLFLVGLAIRVDPTYELFRGG